MKKTIIAFLLVLAAIVAVNGQTAPAVGSWAEITAGTTFVPPTNENTTGETIVIPFVNLGVTSNAGPFQAWLGVGTQIPENTSGERVFRYPWLAGNLGYMIVAPEALDGLWFKPYVGVSLTNGFAPSLGAWSQFSAAFTDKKDSGFRAALDFRYAFPMELDNQDEDVWQMVLAPSMELFFMRDKKGNQLSVGLDGSWEFGNYVFGSGSNRYKYTNWAVGGYVKLPGVRLGVRALQNGYLGTYTNSVFTPYSQWQGYVTLSL